MFIVKREVLRDIVNDAEYCQKYIDAGTFDDLEAVLMDYCRKNGRIVKLAV